MLLSTPFVALRSPWRRRFHLYEHAIFVAYSIASMTLLMIAMELTLPAGVTGGLIWMLAVPVPPVHMFVQLRGAYGLSGFPTTVFLLSFAMFALSLYVLRLVAMGMFHQQGSTFAIQPPRWETPVTALGAWSQLPCRLSPGLQREWITYPSVDLLQLTYPSLRA